jgi:hypothetical protein
MVPIGVEAHVQHAAVGFQVLETELLEGKCTFEYGRQGYVESGIMSCGTFTRHLSEADYGS